MPEHYKDVRGGLGEWAFSASGRVGEWASDLDVYQGAMSLAMDIFRGALTDQAIMRSICANLAETWRKRRYPAAFVSKLNDAETEAGETQVHVKFSFRNNYIERTTF